MPEPTPSSFTGYGTAVSNVLTWTNEDTYDEIEIYRKLSSESTWSALYIQRPALETYTDTALYSTLNLVYEYYLVGAKDGFVDSDPTGTVSIGRYGDTATDTLALTDEATGLQGFIDTATDTVTATDTATAVITWASTCTDTVTVSDSMLSAQSIKTAFAYYIGMYDGTVHTVSADYLSDNGTSITSDWETIETNLGIPSVYKTVYTASLRYVDKTASTGLSVAISNDGGATWAGTIKTVGSADGKTHTKKFFWPGVSGEYFKFKVESASTDKEFQVIGLDVDFLIAGDTVDA